MDRVLTDSLRGLLIRTAVNWRAEFRRIWRYPERLAPSQATRSLSKRSMSHPNNLVAESKVPPGHFSVAEIEPADRPTQDRVGLQVEMRRKIVGRASPSSK